MKYITRVTALFLCITPSLAFAEDKVQSPIVVEKDTFGHYYYIQENNKLSPRQLKEILKAVPSTDDDIKRAEGSRFAGDFFSYVGAGVFGVALGAELAGPNEGDGPNWGAIVLVGGSLWALSSHYHSKSDGYYKKAIDSYNNKLQIKHNYNQMQRFKIHLGSNNLGLSIRF